MGNRIIAEFKERPDTSGNLVPAIVLEVPIFNNLSVFFDTIVLEEVEPGVYQGDTAMTINGFGPPVYFPLNGTLEEIVETIGDELDSFADDIYKWFSGNINAAMTELVNQI